MPNSSLMKNNELGSGANNQFILATSTAVVIVVCFTIWIFFRVTVNKSGVLTAGIKMITPLEMYEGDEHGL